MQVATQLDSAHTGARGESLFANYFVEKRLFICQPLYDLWGSDFVVEWKGALCRVNVKTMYKIGGTYKVSLHRAGGSDREAKIRKYKGYSDAEIDYFGVVNLYYKRIWMVPLEVVNTRTNLNYKGPMETRKKIQGRTFDWEKYRVK